MQPAKKNKKLEYCKELPAAVRMYRAHTNPFYNRAQRRQIAKNAGVFAWPGAFSGLHKPEEREVLDMKTERKEKEIIDVIPA